MLLASYYVTTHNQKSKLTSSLVIEVKLFYHSQYKAPLFIDKRCITIHLLKSYIIVEELLQIYERIFRSTFRFWSKMCHSNLWNFLDKIKNSPTYLFFERNNFKMVQRNLLTIGSDLFSQYQIKSKCDQIQDTKKLLTLAQLLWHTKKFWKIYLARHSSSENIWLQGSYWTTSTTKTIEQNPESFT